VIAGRQGYVGTFEGEKGLVPPAGGDFRDKEREESTERRIQVGGELEGKGNETGSGPHQKHKEEGKMDKANETVEHKAGSDVNPQLQR